MEFSKRITGLSPSATLALNTKAKELAKQGRKIINAAVGEPDFSTPEAIIEVAIAELRKGNTKYGPAGGSPELRKAISNKLKRDNGLDYAPSEVCSGIGAKELLFHASLAFLNEGDEVLLPAPFWVSYEEHIKAAGAKAVIIPVPQPLKEPYLTVKMLEAYATPKTKGLILCSPHNPAGFALKSKDFEELGQYLKKKDWWIISDEIYEYLSFDAPHVSLVQVCPELKEKILIINGMSKGFAMTGWRVGYAAGPKKMIDLLVTMQGHSSTCLPPFIDKAATFALEQGYPLMKDKIATLKKRRDMAIELASKIPDLSYVHPSGAFYLFMDLRKALQGGSFGLDTFAFCDYLLEQFSLACVPGEAFGAPGYIRFSYGIAEEQIEQGLDSLKRALVEQKKT